MICIPVCAGTIIREFIIPSTMLLLLSFKAVFILPHYCSALYLSGCYLFLTTFMFSSTWPVWKSFLFFPFLTDSQLQLTLVESLSPAAVEDSKKYC